jgi:hypothetical protein
MTILLNTKYYIATLCLKGDSNTLPTAYLALHTVIQIPDTVHTKKKKMPRKKHIAELQLF